MALEGWTVAGGEIVTQETLELAKRRTECCGGGCNQAKLSIAVVDLEAALRETREAILSINAYRDVLGDAASTLVAVRGFNNLIVSRIDAVLPPTPTDTAGLAVGARLVAGSTKPICQTCLGAGYFLHGGDFGVSESSPCPDCIEHALRLRDWRDQQPKEGQNG